MFDNFIFFSSKHISLIVMKKASKNSNDIAKSAGIVGFAVMCSRFLGLIREQIFASLFGAGFAYDAFVVAFRIPNLLRDLFGEGALSAAFVTIFSQYDEKFSKEQVWKLASNALIFFSIVVALFCLAGILFAAPLVNLLAPGFQEVAGKTDLTIKLTRIMMPFLLFISLSAVVMGVLNTKGKFFIPSLASSFFNLGSIIGGVTLAYTLPKYGVHAIVGMAIGTLIGGIMQLAVQFPTLFKTGFKFYPKLAIKDPGLRKILKLMLPATIGLSAVQINIFVNTNFAASCVEGSVSWLNYAFRMVQLPIGVFGVAIAIAVMPIFGRHAANKDISGLKETLASSLTMIFCLTLPATAGLIILAEPIIRIIFERGAFTSLDTVFTANTLAFYSIGLFAYSANKLLVPAFYALDNTKYPVIASFIAIIMNICFIKLTITHYQHLAIALSTSFTMVINFIFLTLVLYIKLNGFSVTYLLKGLTKILLATTFMCLPIVMLKNYFSSWFTGPLILQIISLLLTIIIAVICYGIILGTLKLPEFESLLLKMKERLPF